MRFRLLAVVGLLGLFVCVILYRLWALQVRQGDWLRELAQDQYLKEIVLEPMRGAIVDRHGNPLAVSVMTDSIFVMPKKIGELGQTSRALAMALDLDARALAEKISRRKHFTWIKRRVPPAKAKRVRDLALPGVHLTRESRRYYPGRELASSLIGFAGDGQGLEGLELRFDGRLRGSTVLAQGLRDAHGRVLFSEGIGVSHSVAETRLVLSLDLTIQEIVESELEKAIEKTGARAGVVVVMDPSTGEILALANLPSFNPNIYWKFSSARYRNRAISDCYEPGSTMKVFTMAAALQSGAIKATDRYDCSTGEFKIGDHTVHDSSRKHRGLLSLRDVLVYSKNTGTSRMALKMGRQTLWSGLRNLGFGQKTGVEMPGESRCRLRKPGSDFDLAAQSFGQGLSVTSLQMITALSAVANGGVWMRPLLVKEIRGPDNRMIHRAEIDPAGRVLDSRWADLLTRHMVGVTQVSCQAGGIAGLDVAGKTGTAQKADLIAGGYSDKRVASFMGFVPAENPRIAILVVIDEPTTSPYGCAVAAPVFARIGEATLAYLGVFSERPASPGTKPSESLVDSTPPLPMVSVQAPLSAGTRISRIPDLRGLSVRSALRVLAGHNGEIMVSGSGRVVAQVPSAGISVQPATKVILTLENGTEFTKSKKQEDG
jgi:cell division protein FtsI (penicillin-binding protein 3)